MRMISIAQSKLGFLLKLKTLFTSPTIAELAKSLAQGSSATTTLGDDEYSVLLPLKTRGSRPPLFCVHPGQGLSWIYIGLAKHLHPEQPLYGLQARGLDGKAAMAGSVEEMTKDYLAHIREIQSHGPYHLLGWSFGGTVAHSMAVELEKQGEKVALLAIMDSVCDFSAYDDVDEEEYEQDEKEYVQHLSHFAGKSSIDEGLALHERIMPISANNSDLAGRFRPSVFGGDMTYFRAAVPSRDRAPLVDPASWTPYVRGEMAVYDVVCKHLEMDKPENIAVCHWGNKNQTEKRNPSPAKLNDIYSLKPGDQPCSVEVQYPRYLTTLNSLNIRGCTKVTGAITHQIYRNMHVAKQIEQYPSKTCFDNDEYCVQITTDQKTCKFYLWNRNQQFSYDPVKVVLTHKTKFTDT
ncbi:hypothetical protein BGX26_006688, partial [Mortierella sp. AD094]